MATGPPTLTPRQQHVLAWLRDDGPLGTATIATRAAVKVDSMRRMLERLRDRNLIEPAGKARGADRAYQLSRLGRAAIGKRKPAPDRRSGTDRVYTVLLERAPGEFVVLAEKVKAHNIEDAFRRAVREHAVVAEDPVLVAVASRSWQPTPVTVNTKQFVSIG